MALNSFLQKWKQNITPKETLPLNTKFSNINMPREILTHSQINTFKSCRKRYQFRYVERLTPKIKSTKLQLGSAVHHALAEFYKDKAPLLESYNLWWEQEIAKIADLIDETAKEEIETKRLLGQKMLEGYKKEYGTKDFEEYEIVDTEKVFNVPIVNPESNYRSRYFEFAGKFDGLWREKKNGNLWVVETKTIKAWDEDINTLMLDEQVTAYLWALSVMNLEIKGVLYNVLRKVDPEKAKTPVYFRTRVYRSRSELEQFQRGLYLLSREMRKCEVFYRNPSFECSWKCPYRSICTCDVPEMRELFDRGSLHPELEDETT